MEFWGVEIKSGETMKVAPNPESLIHLSQAALGESKKGNESVPLYVKIDDKKILLGTLSQEKFPQLSFDIVFQKEVELYHSGKNGIVYLSGYQSLLPEDGDDGMFSEEDSEEEEPLPIIKGNNGVIQPSGTVKAAAKSNDVKPDSSTKKAKATPPKQVEEESSEDDDSDDDEEDEEDESDENEESEEGMSIDEDSEDEEESESQDEETPKKADKGKKRQNDSAMKTPVSAKKAKAATATPEKTGGKKGAHTATPHPAKGGKSTENGNTKAQTPKSGGKFSCNSCERSFGSDAALQSHSKAKHGGK